MPKTNKKNIIKKVPVEVYSRVVGYFRPVNQWNKGKQAEFRNRHAHNKEDTVSNILREDEARSNIA